MKYLKLQFRNAGFFEVHKGTKDFVFDVNGKHKRETSGQTVSISPQQISNMLHVLLGERPSATYRETFIEPIQDIANMANNSMIKIDTPRYVNKTTNKKYYSKELIKTNKSVWNSNYNAFILVHWKMIENLLTDNNDNSLYIEFIDIIEKILNKSVKGCRAKDIIIEINQNHPNSPEMEAFKRKLLERKKTSLVSFINGDLKNTSFGMDQRTRITTISGIDKITRIGGSIIIPMSEQLIEKLKNSKGCTTLLDGGVVFIDDLQDGSYIGEEYFDGYININELEKYESNY